MSIAMTDALAARVLHEPVWSAERRKHRHHLLAAGVALVLIIRGDGSWALDSVIAKKVRAPEPATAITLA